LRHFISFIKVVLPLGLGIFLIWYFYGTLTPTDKQEILNAFGRANYFWIYISLIFAILSHISRAWRWKYTLRPLGYEPNIVNSFFAVMIAYLVNMAVPRLGELSRVGVMSQYEKMPFEKVLGTVLAERLADLIILLAFATLVLFIQMEIIGGLVQEIIAAISAKFSSTTVLMIGLVLIGGMSSLLYLFFNKQIQHPFLMRTRSFIFGLLEGLKSIWTMRDKWAFIAHTIFIWFMYLMMFYICFLALPETKEVPVGGILTAFVLGGFTVVLTNGGIGAYPLAIQAVLLLYDVDRNTGGAFGWIVWTAQTAMIVLLGALSFAFIAPFNKMRLRWQSA
jgi:uncharacterized protein (TIRG00374 family)